MNRHLTQFYGLDNLGRVGLASIIPRRAVRLHRQAVTVKTSLESPDLVLEPLLEIDLADPENTTVASQMATQLEPELSRLGELLDERHHQNARTLDARLKRQEVIREFDHHIRGIVRLAQGMFRLAGRNELGQRIRPIFQRVLRKLEDQEAQEAEAETQTESESQAGAASETEAGAGTAPEPSVTDSGHRASIH